MPHLPCVHPRRLRGFTLIELLVVVSIVSLLISILLPALASARLRARETQCLAQVRQFGHAGSMYAADNKGSYLPQVKDASDFNYTPVPADNRVMGTHRWAYWADAVAPYLAGNTKVHECPLGAKRLAAQAVSTWSYAINPLGYPVNSTGNRTSTQVLRLDDFRRHSSKLFLMDSGFTINAGSTSPFHHWTPFLALDYFSSSLNRSAPATRHNMRSVVTLAINERPPEGVGFNAVFFDGHAKFVEWRQVVPNFLGLS